MARTPGTRLSAACSSACSARAATDGGDLEVGRIRAYREYADTGVALRQLGSAPENLARVLVRRVPTA